MKKVGHEVDTAVPLVIAPCVRDSINYSTATVATDDGGHKTL